MGAVTHRQGCPNADDDVGVCACQIRWFGEQPKTPDYGDLRFLPTGVAYTVCLCGAEFQGWDGAVRQAYAAHQRVCNLGAV